MEYKYTNQEGEEEKVALEKWAWGVVYQPTEEQKAEMARSEESGEDVSILGDELHQFAANGQFTQIKDIDWPRVRMFTMYKTDMDPSKRIDIAVHPDMQLFHKYRNCILDHGTDQARKVRAYMFGWKDRKTGSETFVYILPDDRIVMGGGDVDITRFGL